MDQLTNEDFVDFLDMFKDDYYCSITEISKPQDSNVSLVYNNFRMFSFDEMCKEYSIMEKNLPKTMDALHYEIDDDGNLTLYIIEFKTFNIEDTKSTYTLLEALHRKFKKLNNTTCRYEDDKKFVPDAALRKFEYIKEYFVDSIEFDLILKPIETLFVALPWLYDEYCRDNEDVVKKDFRGFLNEVNIKLVVFVNRYAPNINPDAEMWSSHYIDNKLKSVYHRLYLSNVIVEDEERIFPGRRFPYFIDREHLNEIYDEQGRNRYY